MKKNILFKISLLNIYSELWRIIMGVIGIIIGITSLVFLVSLGYGLDRIVTKQINNERANKLILVNSNNSTMVKLTQETITKMASIMGIVRVNQSVDLPGKFSWKGSSVEVAVRGVSPDYFSDSGIVLPEGVELMEASADEAQPVLITSSLAQLFDKQTPKNLLGQEIFIDYTLTKATSKDLYESDIDKRIIEGKKFRVIAILNQGLFAYAYIPHSFVLRNGVDYDTSAQVIISNINELEEIRAKIEAEGFSTENVIDYINEVHNFFGILRIVLVLISFITVIVGIIALLNTTESLSVGRRKEIGWLKSIGMSKLEVRFLLITEGMLISFTSASIGIILGLFLCTILNIIIKIIANQHHYSYMPLFYTPVMLVIMLIVISLIFGIVIGFYSSRKGIKIDPKLGVEK